MVRSPLSLESEQRIELIPAEPRCRRHAHPDSEVVLLDPLPDTRQVGDDIDLGALDSRIVDVLAVAETSDHVNPVTLLERREIWTGFAFPGSDQMPGCLDDRTALGILVAVVRCDRHRRIARVPYGDDAKNSE